MVRTSSAGHLVITKWFYKQYKCMKKKQCNPACLYRWKKLFLMMRITAMFMLAALIHVSASVYSQKTNLELRLKDVSVEEVLRKIEEQSNFYFLYRSDFLKDLPKVSINVTKAGLEEILNQIVVPYGFGYEIDDRIVVIRKISEEPIRTRQDQKLTVKGKVTDSSGTALPGVTILLKGTGRGTTTDVSGSYSLAGVPADGTLVFTFIGMKPVEVPVAGNQTISVQMEEEAIGLGEVVAVGYGYQKKRDVSGAISSVNSESIVNTPVKDVMSALRGRASGVHVVSNSGAPGDGITVTVRDDPS